jgi:hypothetical protein
MNRYTVSANEIGVYEKTLPADQVDVVAFDDDVDFVEVISDGAASIFLTSRHDIDPTVGGQGCFYLPAVACSRVFHVPGSGPSTIKLISSGAPVYSVSRAVED